MRVAVQSRQDEKSAWRERWSGESYLIVTETERRESPPARFDATTDRTGACGSYRRRSRNAPTGLELGYSSGAAALSRAGSGAVHDRLRQSARAERRRPTRCDALLADVSAKDRAQMIAEGYAGGVRELGWRCGLQAPAEEDAPAADRAVGGADHRRGAAGRDGAVAAEAAADTRKADQPRISRPGTNSLSARAGPGGRAIAGHAFSRLNSTSSSSAAATPAPRPRWLRPGWARARCC